MDTDSTGDKRVMTTKTISIGPLNSRGRDSNTGDSEIFGATQRGASEGRLRGPTQRVTHWGDSFG